MTQDWFISDENKKYSLEKKGDTWWIYVDGSPTGGGSDGEAGERFQKQEFQRLKNLLGK